jgi:hypothetical protein
MTGPDDQPSPSNHAAQASAPDASRELHRRTRILALTASALTLTGVWAGYSWTQAHREGLQFQTADVAEALVWAVVTFAAGAALGGVARPLRRRFPRLAAYLTLVVPVLILGAVAVQEATDRQVGGSAPVVDVLGVACAILVGAMFGVRLTKARPAGARRGGRARGPWPAWLAGIAIAVPVVLVGGTAGLAAQQATIVSEYDSRPFAHGQRSPLHDGRRTFTPAQVGLEHRYPAVAATVNDSAVDMAEIAAQWKSRAGSKRSPVDWTRLFPSWTCHQGCLAAKPQVWLPVLRTEMSRHCSAFGRIAGRDPAETVYRDVLAYTTRRCRQLAGDTKAEPTLWLRRALPAHSPVADATARIETRVEKAVTDETCDAGARNRD